LIITPDYDASIALTYAADYADITLTLRFDRYDADCHWPTAAAPRRYFHASRQLCRWYAAEPMPPDSHYAATPARPLRHLGQLPLRQ
jgi:hypothetical protein